MTLIKFDPLRGFENVGRKMSQLANDFDKGFSVDYGGFNPKVDITEDKSNIYVHLEIPGLSKEDVKISINDDNILTIKGEKKSHQKEESKTFLRTERMFGSFTRSFVLPENINTEQISAKHENGVIEMIIPKVEPPLPKEINIDIA